MRFNKETIDELDEMWLLPELPPALPFWLGFLSPARQACGVHRVRKYEQVVGSWMD